MSSFPSSTFRLILLGALLAVFASATFAEDEDLTSSVYLVFDAETGEFVEVDDPDRVQQTHDAKDPADTLAMSGSSGSPPLLVIGVLIAVLALIGAYAVLLARRRSQ